MDAGARADNSCTQRGHRTRQFLTCVCTLELDQVGANAESLTTLGTGEGLLTRVHPLVFNQLLAAAKNLLTLWALVGSEA